VFWVYLFVCFDVLLVCLCECFFSCVSEVCVCEMCGCGCVWRLYVCVCLREMCVGVGVVVWFPFFGDRSGAVAGVFCECIVFLCLEVECVFCVFWLFFVGLVCFCFVFCEFLCFVCFDCEVRVCVCAGGVCLNGVVRVCLCWDGV